MVIIQISNSNNHTLINLRLQESNQAVVVVIVVEVILHLQIARMIAKMTIHIQVHQRKIIQIVKVQIKSNI